MIRIRSVISRQIEGGLVRFGGTARSISISGYSVDVPLQDRKTLDDRCEWGAPDRIADPLDEDEMCSDGRGFIGQLGYSGIGPSLRHEAQYLQVMSDWMARYWTAMSRARKATRCTHACRSGQSFAFGSGYGPDRCRGNGATGRRCEAVSSRRGGTAIGRLLVAENLVSAIACQRKAHSFVIKK
jgi:hypothetical protein